MPEEEDLHCVGLRQCSGLPKVDLRWAYIGPNNPTPSDLKDADNYELEQDTIFQLTNDFEGDVRLQVIVANGDGAIPAVNESGTINDFRAHPGWNQEVFDVRLTGNQPQVASFAAGGRGRRMAREPQTTSRSSFIVLDDDTGVNAERLLADLLLHHNPSAQPEPVESFVSV